MVTVAAMVLVVEWTESRLMAVEEWTEPGVATVAVVAVD